MTTWTECERNDVYWLLRMNEALTVQSDRQDFSKVPPPPEGSREAAARELWDGVDSESPPEDGPRGGRWVGLNVTRR